MAVTVLPLLPLSVHFPHDYLHVINPNRVSVVTWLHLSSLSSHVTRGKHRCRLSGWPAEPALLVDRVYTGRTPFQGYLGVDYLDRGMTTFNKSRILPPIKLSSWQIGSTVFWPCVVKSDFKAPNIFFHICSFFDRNFLIISIWLFLFFLLFLIIKLSTLLKK